VLVQVEQLGLPEAEIEEVKDALEYAVESATWARGRIDWTNVVAGYVFTKVTDAMLTQDTMHTLFRLLTVGVAHLFGHHFPELGPGPH
jgi:hypothetical protein